MSRVDYEKRHYEGLNPVSVDTGLVATTASFADVVEFDTLGSTVVGFIIENKGPNTINAKLVGRNDHKGLQSPDWDYDDSKASTAALASGATALLFVTVKTTKVALQVQNGSGAGTIRAFGFKY